MQHLTVPASLKITKRCIYATIFLFTAAASVLTCAQDGIVEMDLSLENTYAAVQYQLAVQETEQQQDYGLISNSFYEGERLKIYNFTAYDAQAAQNKFVAGQSSLIGMDDFSISFGYGMEWKIRPRQSIGYEYLSNFPYDRGQIIRLFWNGQF